MALSEHASQVASGVYAIRHLLSGRCYVGSAKNMGRRWRRHRNDLTAGAHHSVKLQRAWSKYGSDAFSFEVLQSVGAHADLVKNEQAWIDKLDSFHNGFNSRPIASSPLGVKQSAETIAKRMAAMKGYRPTPETIEKIRQANKISHGTVEARAAKSARLKALGRTLTPEQKEAVSKATKARVISEETRAKQSAAQKGRTHSAETRARISAAKFAQSEETKAKISAAHKGKKLSPEHVAKIVQSKKIRRDQRKAAESDGRSGA